MWRFLFIKYFQEDQITEDEMSGACNIHARDNIYKYGRNPQKKETFWNPRRIWKNYIVTCQRIARQRLDKQTAMRARNIRTNVYSSLLGNELRANDLAR
jgi:hypothetical protein